MNFYKHHIGDYAQATSHLSFVEDAAYSRLLRKYYAEEKPLPADKRAVQRLVAARTREEREAVDMVLDEFFVLEEDGWHNKRADAELAKANAQAETNRKIAEEREARKRERAEREEAEREAHGGSTNRADAKHGSFNDSLHDSLASREPSQTPDTRHQTPDTTTSVPNTATSDEVAGRPAAGPPQLALVPPPIQPGPYEPPDCPHVLVLRLWADVLPAMPQHEPEQWKGARADHLRTRWRETAAAKRWPDQAAGLTYLRRLFAFVAQSRFLTGRVPPRDRDRPPFTVTLAWLVRPTNWAEVIEGKYHQDAA